MAVYLIDYENVHSDGLNGVGKLNANDTVCIFYSEKADRMSFGLHRRLTETKAAIEYYKVSVCAGNALDFQLTSLLGYRIAKCESEEYIIVSKDKGFDSAVLFWSNRKINISRVEDITTNRQISNNELIKKITDALGSEYSDYSQIAYDAVVNSESKMQANNYLIKKFTNGDNKLAGEIYGRIKPFLPTQEQNEWRKKLNGVIDPKYIEIVVEAIETRKSKSGIHTYLVKALSNQKLATETYNSIKPFIKDKS